MEVRITPRIMGMFIMPDLVADAFLITWNQIGSFWVLVRVEVGWVGVRILT